MSRVPARIDVRNAFVTAAPVAVQGSTGGGSTPGTGSGPGTGAVSGVGGSTIIPNRTVDFYDESSGAGDDAPNSWAWEFRASGTGILLGTSTVENPNFTFPAAGTYRVTLTVGNALGDSATVTKDVVVT